MKRIGVPSRTLSTQPRGWIFGASRQALANPCPRPEPARRVRDGMCGGCAGERAVAATGVEANRRADGRSRPRPRAVSRHRHVLAMGPARLSSLGAARAVRVAAGRPRQPCPDRSLGSAETIRALFGARRGRAPAPPPQPAPHAARMRERPLPSVFSCSN
ncbi:hypothetical protein Maq22A_c28530 [Methylobacterium aquaticum]|uniref:Uncharacterized protein n=1 Tax=Methylobacterium aquaticum TaxID=270351 RepID=A0A1Y0ZC95_9HYPH|nr:hypothetical protein Maq22A_c28530 [Methylobacterium aquaticum]